MSKRLTSSQWQVTAVFIAVGALILWVGMVCIVKYIQLSQQVADIKPKLARFYGLIESEEQLIKADESLTQQLADLTYGASEDVNTLGARMQQTARKIFSDEGMSINGSQVLPFKAENGFTLISVRIDIDGEYKNLEPALLALQELRPVVFIDNIEVSPARRQRGSQQQKINARIKLLSLKMGE